MRTLLRPSLDWLLIFVPVTLLLEFLAPAAHTLVFWTACLAIIPLAAWLGRATEHLAEKTSEGTGALLNATFGNAAEMIIALMALKEGLGDLVKASLTGSILGNLLLVLGASALWGGLKFKTQKFSIEAARVQATMLILAAIALVVPAVYHHLAGPLGQRSEAGLSLEIAVVLLASYALGLVFSLRTHRHYFCGHAGQPEKSVHGQLWSIRKSLIVLAVSTALVGWISEILVGSVEHAAHAFGMTSLFVGVIIVGIVGNAAEHSTAILAARKNKMDLSVGIAAGSTIQIALFVAPVLVLASYWIGPRPMDLVFTPAEVLAIVMAVWIAGHIAGDGESNWLEGAQLLAVYLVIAIVFYFLPG
ncbi:MAG: calcium/proton exchanger [Acidobacteriota bacterium]